MKYTADFETTTDPNDCRVWAYGICQIDNPDNFIFGNSIDDFMDFCKHSNPTLYFHNLKFDGDFILNWLFRHDFQYVTKGNERSKTFTTLISDMGQFYTMTIFFEVKGKHSRKVVIYDSLKIIPLKVSDVAKSFGLPISKLEIDYDEKRPIGHELTLEEIEYLKNDVTIMALALKEMFNQNLKKMTQGSCALEDYKTIIGKHNFKKWYPPPSYDEDIRRSYKGGWTYLNPKFAGIDLNEGIVLDVNSLYPSRMYYKPMPYGEGVFFEGEYKENKYYNLYVQMFKCAFELKPDHLPTIQLKGNRSFVQTEYVTTSKGEQITLCLTCVDLKLFLDHYDVWNLQYISGWAFKSTVGLFKDYIDKWNKVKVESTLNGNKGMRTIAKLMMNALYGKFALNPNVQSKFPVFENGKIRYALGEKEIRDPIYIPMGSFITSWARYMTITSAQAVFDRFVYADTDSLHLVGTDLPDNLEIDASKLGAWKHESTFTRARFLRAKSYIEEINGNLHITCAGLPSSSHHFVTWDNFKPGASYSGKLLPQHVEGGIVLKDIDFTIR